MVRTLLPVLFFACGQAAAQTPERWIPLETARTDPALMTFRQGLLDAVRQRDAEAVAAVASPDIHLSFGGTSGRQKLIEGLTASCSEGCEVGGDGYWQELEEALALGGMHSARDPSVYITPYVFWSPAPYEGGSGYDTLVALGESVPVFVAPDATSRQVGTLDRDILLYISSPNSDWYKVRNSVGLEGFVAADAVRSPVDYRAVFERDESGKWSMTVFIAGD
jgi:hypothetical protein